MWYRLKTGLGPWTWEKTEPLKNGPVGKTKPQGLKTLSFVFSHMKDSVEMFHVDVQSRGAQGLIFVQIAFEKCTTIFYFEDDKVSIKTTIAKL